MPSDQDQGGVHDLQLQEEKADLVVVQSQPEDYYEYNSSSNSNNSNSSNNINPNKSSM